MTDGVWTRLRQAVGVGKEPVPTAPLIAGPTDCERLEEMLRMTKPGYAFVLEADLFQCKPGKEVLCGKHVRADADDWMPYRVRVCSDSISTYYININKQSPIHDHGLVLNMSSGVLAIFNEWDGSRLVSSVPARVEQNPSADRPTDDEFITIAGYVAACGGMRGDPPTINGQTLGKQK
jgi:hypothetical protein